jgi:hypothetical protein
MDTALNDAAFRLVSHSQVTIDANFRAPRTDEARLVALRVQFRDARPEAIAEALERARLLEDTAIQMADAFRGRATVRTGRRLPARRSPSDARASRMPATAGPSTTGSRRRGSSLPVPHFAFSVTSAAWPPFTSSVTGPASSPSEPGFGRPVRM